MAKFDRIDAGLGVLFDIHNNKANDLVPAVFVVAKKDVEKVCGLRNMRIEKLVAEIADAMSGMGFVRACGHWAVSELEYDRILFQKIPDRVTFMCFDSLSIEFREMTIQQALERSLVPNKLPAPAADFEIRMQGAESEQPQEMRIVKKRQAEAKTTIVEPVWNKTVICKYCDSPISDEDAQGLEYGHHAECVSQDDCDCCGNPVDACTCASRFMSSDDLQPCAGGCGRTKDDCTCGDL